LGNLSGDIDPNEFRKQHMELNTQQLKDVTQLPQAEGLITNYQRLAKELPLGQPGLGRLKSYATIKAMRLAGDPAIQDLDSINAQITGLATAFGGDKRVSDAEMRLLKGAVIVDGDTGPGVQRKIANLEKFYNGRVKTSGLPWLKPLAGEAPDSGTPPPSSPPNVGGGGGQSVRAKSKSGKPIVSNDGGKTWSYE
jgi:hypothetical protein